MVKMLILGFWTGFKRGIISASDDGGGVSCTTSSTTWSPFSAAILDHKSPPSPLLSVPSEVIISSFFLHSWRKEKKEELESVVVWERETRQRSSGCGCWDPVEHDRARLEKERVRETVVILFFCTWMIWMTSDPESNGCDEVMLGSHSTHAKIHITSCLCLM